MTKSCKDIVGAILHISACL